MKARNKLILAYTPLAEAMAARLLQDRNESQRSDFIQEAHIGLLKAIDRFDPDRGFRLSTYAAWWVRAEIQTFKLNNWSLVRRGTSTHARKAFFQLGRVEMEMTRLKESDPTEIDKTIASNLGITRQRLNVLRTRFSGVDKSLDVQPGDGDSAIGSPDLVDQSELLEHRVRQKIDQERMKGILSNSLAKLPCRERKIVLLNVMIEPKRTLESLAADYGVSKERIRQLRNKGLERLRRELSQKGIQAQDFF
ncbi:MAG: sigma-70 family RNA polymerase sigma factor [Gammaproteobacteria bacterium]|nr:sigma-70 family RNA polymerase sigma factor [Gammaproteobacteria bacterium]